MDTIEKSFEANWPIIQRKLIEKGFPLSKRNVEYYKMAAFREYRKNWNDKIVPELKRRRAEDMRNMQGMYEAQQQAYMRWRT